MAEQKNTVIAPYDDFDINSFKTVVLNAIIENNEIINILDKDCIDSGGNLLYKKIFPYMQNPKTIQLDDPFICFRVNHNRNASHFLEQISVEIDVVCHEKGMNKKVRSYKTGKILSGTVIDILGEEIKRTLSGLDTEWIGELTCVGNTETVLYYKYPARILTFTAMKESYAHHK